jgi:hypothetical protein
VRCRRRPARVAAIEPGHAHLSLDFDLGAAPIQGSIHTDVGETWRFEGWTELAYLIDQAIAPPDARVTSTDERRV